MRMRQIKIGTSITFRDTASMERYLQEISRIKRISAEDELLLSEKIKQGCEQSLHKLVESNLRFVISVCKQYQHQGLPLSDLINEGNLGLLKAARRFDGTKGFKFISYAVWWIRQAVLQSTSRSWKSGASAIEQSWNYTTSLQSAVSAGTAAGTGCDGGGAILIHRIFKRRN